MKNISVFAVLLVVACGGTAVGEPPDETDDTSSAVRACLQTALCIQGDVWSQKSCSCVPVKGAKCGSKTCGAKEYCCNTSCGICAPLGSMCIQIACTP